MDEYSIQSIHDSLKNRLINYLLTAYFGKNDDLRELCIDEIKKKAFYGKSHISRQMLHINRCHMG